MGKGDQAPINGQFNGFEVASGTVAMESGTFCVDQDVLALVQRSWGLSSAEEVEEVVNKKSKAAKKKAKDAKVKAVDSGKESAEEAKAEEKAAVKEGKITAEEAKKDEKKVEKATAAKKKKKALIEVPAEDGILSLVQTVKDNSQELEQVVKKKTAEEK